VDDVADRVSALENKTEETKSTFSSWIAQAVLPGNRFREDSFIADPPTTTIHPNSDLFNQPKTRSDSQRSEPQELDLGHGLVFERNVRSNDFSGGATFST